MWNSNGQSNRSELENIQWVALVGAIIAILGIIRDNYLTNRK